MKVISTTLAALAALAVSSVAHAQETTVDHYRMRGYYQLAVFSGGGGSAIFSLTQGTRAGSSEPPQTILSLGATSKGPWGMAVVQPIPGATPTITLRPMGPSLNGTSYARVSVPAMFRVIFSPAAPVYGTLEVETTMAGTGSLEVSRDIRHYNLADPQFGLLFQYSQNAIGRFIGEGYGEGSVTFIPDEGDPLEVIPAGTPIGAMSIGHILEGSLFVSR